MWSSNDLSLIRADLFSFRGLWQTPIVLELFKPAEFGKEPSNLSMKLACYVLDEDIFYPHLLMAADLRQRITFWKLALVHLKEHLFLMMYCLWRLSVKACHLKV